MVGRRIFHVATHAVREPDDGPDAGATKQRGAATWQETSTDGEWEADAVVLDEYLDVPHRGPDVQDDLGLRAGVTSGVIER
jgi:hypothetical protein